MGLTFSSVYSSTNCWNLNFSVPYVNNNNRYNRNYVRAVRGFILVMAFPLKFSVPLVDLVEASKDCAKHKRSTRACMQFNNDEMYNLLKLKQELETGTYRPGKSKCFVVKEPKPREVFASSYRDRVVQHLYLYYTRDIFTKFSIKNSYACIDGRGVLYGQKKLREMIRRATHDYTREVLVASLDIKSNFCSIDRNILLKNLEEFLISHYKGWNLNFILWLTKIIVSHNPTENYELAGDPSDWEMLPYGKSLFDRDTGLPIGDITSQIFNNFLISIVDNYAVKDLGIEYYGRYVDDIKILEYSEESLKDHIVCLRRKLSDVGLNFNEKKVQIQRVRNGVDFIGSVVYPSCIICRPSTFNRFLHKYENSVLDDVSSINSSLGSLVHFDSYDKMCMIYNSLSDASKNEYEIISSGQGNFKIAKVKASEEAQNLTKEMRSHTMLSLT